MSENNTVRKPYDLPTMLQMWLCACPSYEEVKAYCKAYNALIDYMYIPESNGTTKHLKVL